jgi:hypothetical protein
MPIVIMLAASIGVSVGIAARVATIGSAPLARIRTVEMANIVTMTVVIVLLAIGAGIAVVAIVSCAAITGPLVASNAVSHPAYIWDAKRNDATAGRIFDGARAAEVAGEPAGAPSTATAVDLGPHRIGFWLS